MASLSTSCAPVPELQLSPDELQLLLETTSPTADDEDPLWRQSVAMSGHTSGDDASSTTETSDPAQLKRARRTEIEKLSRRRRQATLRDMREEVRQLEEQMSSMLRVAEDEKLRTGAEKKPRLGDLQVVRDRFVQLSIETQRLEAEKQGLRRMLRSRQLLQQSIKSLATVFVDDWDESTWYLMLERTYEPLPREEHFRIMRESYEAVVAYDHRTDLISSGNSFMGWVDQRYEHKEGMMFSFTKRFEGHDAERVMLDTWNLFSQEERLNKSLFRANTRMRLRLLQQPNDDVKVLHRQARLPKYDKTFHAVCLLFRLRTDDGYTICVRSIPAPGIQQAMDDGDEWVDEFNWVHFNYCPGGCEVSFGGALSREHKHKVTIPDILLGCFAMAVRWENVCIAPMFIKAAEIGNVLN